MLPFPRMISPTAPIQRVGLIDGINTPDQRQEQGRRPQRVKEPIGIEDVRVPPRLGHGIGQTHTLKVRNCLRGIPQVRLDKCFLPSFISLGRFLDLVPV